MSRPRCQRGAAGAARLPAAGSPPGSGKGKPDAEGGGLCPWTAASWVGRGLARARLARLKRRDGGEEVAWGDGGRRPREVCEAATREAQGRSGAGPGPPPAPSPKSTCFFRFVLFLARYWEDFHSCTVTALTDCQEGAKDMWDKLRKESKNLNIQGSLFELCGSGNGAAGSLLPALPVLLVSLSAALATWLSF